AEPGARHGSTLIAGHTVHDGGGALDDLGTLTPGATLVVTTSRGTLRYRVTDVRSYRKGALAAQARHLFARSGPARLVVVTCTDWDGVRYLSNTVVTAVPLGGRPH
ncbi:MAG TPA: class F sortase, partial [Nocardioides sp.]|nr:class F sortase [Nocardioides sp.]